MHSQRSDYLILRNGNTHGPCSIDEIRSYLTYGCMQPGDMVGPVGRAEWSPAAAVLASVKALDERGSADTDPLFYRLCFVLRRTWRQLRGQPAEGLSPLEARRRIVRFRDWEKVPVRVRGTSVMWRLVTGFCCNPLRLWGACAQVFASRVFRRATDEEGWLKTWPKSMETVCAFLIVLHFTFWCWLIYFLADKAAPVIRVVSEIVAECCRDGIGS